MVTFNGQKYNGALETTDQYLYRELFTKIKPGFFIECGALNGASISNCKILEDSLGWSGLNIEPSSAFNELILRRPKSINIRAALGSKDFETLDFNESTVNFATSSFDSELVGKTSSPNKIKTITYSYKTLIDMLNIKSVDFFSLDVEGYEVNVLEGMFGSYVLPSYIFIETHYSDKIAIQTNLDKLGYTKVSIFHLDELYKLKGRDGPSELPSFY